MARNDLSNSDSMDELLEHPAPFYERVKAMIKTKIHSGAWPANYRVPSESELVTLFGYSRMTINRALRELTAEGLLVRMQGGRYFCRRNSRPVGAAGH
ncbi:Histidine utilization repressor [Klebsiella michiganensis]|nr:Histidine utilization repressor [Klebsiella michiganensis]